jgi:hypothetical protein
VCNFCNFLQYKEEACHPGAFTMMPPSLENTSLIPNRKTQCTKSSLLQDLVNMMSQWNEVDLERPFEICVNNSASGHYSLNHEFDDEENTLPPPKPFCHINRSLKHDAPKIISQDSCQYHPESGIALIHLRSKTNVRSSYNRRLGRSGLDSDRPLEIEGAPIDRCAELDLLLDCLQEGEADTQ